MSDVKLTKTQLRSEQVKLERLRKYLPTLQLKKALLQSEVNLAQGEIDTLLVQKKECDEKVNRYARLLTDRSALDLFGAVGIEEVQLDYENIAGVEVPQFLSIQFAKGNYSLFATPVWFESAIVGLKEVVTIREKIRVAQEKKKALEKELREVSIRVNLFEKILIPRSLSHIKRIKIFLGDQQLAAVCQAKVAKKKIMERMAGKK